MSTCRQQIHRNVGIVPFARRVEGGLLRSVPSILSPRGPQMLRNMEASFNIGSSLVDQHLNHVLVTPHGGNMQQGALAVHLSI